MDKLTRTLVDMPHMRFRGMEYAELTQDVMRQTPITGFDGAIPCVTLRADGTLIITAGFHYDFGSGPAVDTPAMIYASLCHDALYNLMQADELPWDCRKDVDKFLRAELLQAGMHPVRAWWCYWGVRVGYPIWSWWAGDQHSDTR
jgi:hypothetical protein